jgi:hypothetical protein
MLAVHLDNPALVNAGVLNVGDRLGFCLRGCLGCRRGRSRCRYGWRRDLARRQFRGLGATRPLLVATTLRLDSPALEENVEFLLAGECAERPLCCQYDPPEDRRMPTTR